MSTTSRPTTTTTGIRPAMPPCASLASCSGRGAAAAGYRRAPGRGGVRRVALRQRGGQHPGHRRAPAAGGGGAGHRAPGLQRRPLPDHQPGVAYSDLRHGPRTRLSRGRPRGSTGPRMQGATRCAWRSGSTTASNRGTEKAPVGAFRRMERLSLGWAYPVLQVVAVVAEFSRVPVAAGRQAALDRVGGARNACTGPAGGCQCDRLRTGSGRRHRLAARTRQRTGMAGRRAR